MTDFDPDGFDPDDFDDDFDETDLSFPGTGPEGFADLDPETLAALDGASADAFAARKVDLTRILAGGETGVQFASLALFAEPLFSLYELDPEDAFRLLTSPRPSPTTRSRCSRRRACSGPSSRSRRPSRPTAGRPSRPSSSATTPPRTTGSRSTASSKRPSPTGARWTRDEVAAAQQTGHETLGFDALLHHPAFRVGTEADDATHAGFGPDALSDVEARALFAQPLLDAVDPAADADAFEDALARADAYWAFARTTDAPADAAAGRAFARDHAGTSAEEAETMVRRYRELFPEKG